jgi:hypothetical protein
MAKLHRETVRCIDVVLIKLSEPPRDLWRLHYLREWSHEEIEQVFPEIRERTVRMVLEHRGKYASLWAAIESIAPKIGHVPQTLNDWVRKHEVETGQRDGDAPTQNRYTSFC